MNPPPLDLTGGGAGFSWISFQNNFTVFLFFFIVELSESFERSKESVCFGGAGTFVLGKGGKQLGKGGGPLKDGNNPGGGGGGPLAVLTAGHNISSSESCRRSEKSRSHRWNSRSRQPFFSSSQCKSFSETLISCIFGDFSIVGLLITSETNAPVICFVMFWYCVRLADAEEGLWPTRGHHDSSNHYSYDFDWKYYYWE